MNQWMIDNIVYKIILANIVSVNFHLTENSNKGDS